MEVIEVRNDLEAMRKCNRRSRIPSRQQGSIYARGYSIPPVRTGILQEK